MTQTVESFVRETTPSGIEIHYEWAPKRLYRIRKHLDTIELAEANIDYDTPEAIDPSWFEVPSVTTVLDCLKKDGLHWWGMTVGIESLMSLFRSKTLAVVDGFVVDPSGWLEMALTVEQVVEKLKQFKLTVNHVRDKAGDRGAAVHDALEAWAKTGIVPELSMFPLDQQGYVKGLLRFIDHTHAEPLDSEVLVGSLEHGYAGRYDLRINVPKKCNVVYKHTPVKGDHWAELEPGLLLTDLKTSKGVYFSHSRQLEAYEQASVECGYEPTRARGILHVTPEGYYEFVRSVATFEDFRCVLDVWRSDQVMKERKR